MHKPIYLPSFFLSEPSMYVTGHELGNPLTLSYISVLHKQYFNLVA